MFMCPGCNIGRLSVILFLVEHYPFRIEYKNMRSYKRWDGNCLSRLKFHRRQPNACSDIKIMYHLMELIRRARRVCQPLISAVCMLASRRRPVSVIP